MNLLMLLRASNFSLSLLMPVPAVDSTLTTSTFSGQSGVPKDLGTDSDLTRLVISGTLTGRVGVLDLVLTGAAWGGSRELLGQSRCESRAGRTFCYLLTQGGASLQSPEDFIIIAGSEVFLVAAPFPLH